MTIPLWMTSEQADRLKDALEAAGFVDVTFATDGGELVVTASGHEERASKPTALTGLVGRFEKWRELHG